MSLVEKVINNIQRKDLQYVIDLEKKILTSKLTLGCQNLLIDVEDRETAQQYFYLHTLPMLEGLGLLEQQENAIFWGTVQLCLDLHLRYVDYIIDDDKIDISRLLITQKSYDYLFRAQMLLNQRGYLWRSEQIAIYTQYFDYEKEVNSDRFHDFGSLWRRVSPLFVISGSYLKSCNQIVDFDFYYKRYISYLLLKADCLDIIKDIYKQKTPITNLVYNYDSQIDKNVMLMADTIKSIEVKLDRVLTQIKNHIFNKLPIWAIIIESLLS
ncbi:MAG: hypothetical protein EAZ39_27425 [Oscillatoriales cyanobacterium]|uniref:hypothetical protein n=1 Tax=Microcoleus sp. PH2017_05_CCC_O_A TaxID=2798816 RepID=UPI001DC59920|nr:hypothetical protein [Microcoleus sp. PH2017_05_CCC_O_A]MCC3436631.1 hypothetical protein [Microcoleus sp. PH2017_05_CCC_O_A]TAE72260.1 MAG: hypothetical protein EAZ86_00360 [Oscillatoriales cyanobacterium]TAF95001.1 MAG: hypothetical protein EAZ45_26510 [Oscillatoriales cyanobacterium]TAG13695.1 MAG: hypothetical protein EAZ39_27425 [Oscillatoriales cyanobacterium]